MIDHEKMRALAAKLRNREAYVMQGPAYLMRSAGEAADAIDFLLAEVEAAEGPGSPSCRLGGLLTALEERFPGVADPLSSRGPEPLLLAAIDKLRVELEAAAVDKRDAALWRKWAPWMKNLRRKPFDLAVALDRISLAQRQEGS